MFHSIFRWWPVALLHAALCHAAPFIPAGDDTLVERLPVRIGDAAERRQQRALREQLRRHPAELSLATRLARDAIARARRDGDPRELGQAQAALAPWWNELRPPAPVRLLRAIVRQSQHDFDTALQDLDALLQPGPQPVPLAIQAQAELTRASVLQVQGRWREADAGCERLLGAHYADLGAAVRLPAQVCRAELMSLQGQAAQAAAALAEIAQRPDVDAGWLALVRAELAERSADAAAAGVLYRRAIAASSSPDVYTLAAYADWLLAQHREREVASLLAGREDADALLLRLAIAWKRSADPRAAPAIATLAARFDAARLRGDRSHGREQSRYQLDLRGDAPAALASAQANWVVQKEPADALLLVRAALAAKQPQAAQPVWQLIRDAGWQDARLQALAGSGE
ncbi:hypothetical protein [Rhizobacter sp. Root29]|uniref:hypothetical protein n=2 Tax=Rhizobacter TaxID=212743 RepID=UPI000A674F02|nr:hypothetical protein [Rhizobacter sp. Root29]